MASRGKTKTTMAKLQRETRLRERKLAKASRKEARQNVPEGHEWPDNFVLLDSDVEIVVEDNTPQSAKEIASLKDGEVL